MESTCTLSWKLDGKLGHHRLDSGSATLGRDAGCAIRIDRDTISRKHALFRREGSGWYVSDLGSRNGIYVNGEKVEKKELNDQDHITVGTVELICGLTRGAPSNARIELDADDSSDSIASSISMDDLAAQLSSDSGTYVGPGANTTMGAGADTKSAAGLPIKMPLLELFQTAAETLLSGSDLDTILDRVLELVFRSIPRVERGFVCLLDDDGELVPRASRTAVPGANVDLLRISRSVADASIRDREAVLVQDARLDDRFNTAESIVSMRIRSVMCAPLTRGEDVAGIVYVDTVAPGNSFEKDDLTLLSTLSMLSAVAVEQARLREEMEKERNLRSHLGRFLSPNVVDQLVAGEIGAEQAMQSREAEITVLFADLVGFTSMSERLTAPEITALLNQVFEVLTDQVFDHGGTLDKYNGDEIVAFFGAPQEQEDHPERAVRCCLHMQTALERFNDGRDDGDNALRMRIGVNTGLATVGDVGHPERRDYTVIGDSVNTAKRLESTVCEPGQVVVGPRTRELLEKSGLRFLELGPVPLKGKELVVIPWKVLRLEEESDTGELDADRATDESTGTS